MTCGRLVIVAIALGASAEAQNTVVGLTPDVWHRNGFGMHVGRELRPIERRFSLRLSAEYSRSGRSGLSQVLAMGDSGLVTRPVFRSAQSRLAGVWLTSSYRPIRWVIEPYVIGGLGLQDSYLHYEWTSPDSAWRSNQWTRAVGNTSTRSWFGPAVLAGYGVSARLGRATLFAEHTLRTEMSPNGLQTGLLLRPLRPAVGIRF